ncbi:RNA polymerase III transcription factor IIIC subunit-domain-containing protein, partial [Piptocephalis cylindrospora]
APCFPIPTQTLYSVEYPGRVLDGNRALDTLGGPVALAQVGAVSGESGMVDLRYRPKDLFSRPIQGRFVDTSNILLRVTRRPARTDRMDEEVDSATSSSDWDFEAVGVIRKTCRFRALADFQYLPEKENPYHKLGKAISAVDVDALTKFRLDQVDEKSNVPPPAFSRNYLPLDYRYLPNPLAKRTITREEGKPSKVEFELKPRLKPNRTPQFVVDFGDPIPKGPSEMAVKCIKDVLSSDVEKVRECFQERPIWTRLALEGTIALKNPYDLYRTILPALAYNCQNGPWRDCWIRFGYDPLKEPSSRAYQVVEVRVKGNNHAGPRAKIVLPGAHVFNGRPTVARNVLFQLCDIHEARVRRVIDLPALPRIVCDVSVLPPFPL